jgi:hypothetical protein
MSSEDIEAGSR